MSTEWTSPEVGKKVATSDKVLTIARMTKTQFVTDNGSKWNIESRRLVGGNGERVTAIEGDHDWDQKFTEAVAFMAFRNASRISNTVELGSRVQYGNDLDTAIDKIDEVVQRLTKMQTILKDSQKVLGKGHRITW